MIFALSVRKGDFSLLTCHDMTLDEYLAKLDRNLAELSRLDWMREPVQDTHAEHIQQIFIKGEDDNKKVERYKDGSYKRYRERKGRQVAFVDLNLLGDLFRDFSSTLVKLGGSWVTGVKRPINADKISGMEKLYGSGKFKLQPELIEKFKVRLKTNITRILTQ